MASFHDTDSFDNMQQLRERLKLYSLANNCPYYLKYSRPSRLEARCPSTRLPQTEGNACGFRLTAYKHADGQVRLRKLELVHSAFCTSKASASEYAIKERAAPLLSSFGKVRPRDMMNVIREECGTPSTYNTVWRALDKGRREQGLGDDKSFLLLRSYLQTFADSNPWSVTSMECAADASFNRAFLCPRTTQLAFRHCRPAISFDYRN